MAWERESRVTRRSLSSRGEIETVKEGGVAFSQEQALKNEYSDLNSSRVHWIIERCLWGEQIVLCVTRFRWWGGRKWRENQREALFVLFHACRYKHMPKHTVRRDNNCQHGSKPGIINGRKCVKDKPLTPFEGKQQASFFFPAGKVAALYSWYSHESSFALGKEANKWISQKKKKSTYSRAAHNHQHLSTVKCLQLDPYPTSLGSTGADCQPGLIASPKLPAATFSKNVVESLQRRAKAVMAAD